jgi:glycerophosphoryl diester phosphodiesterase
MRELPHVRHAFIGEAPENATSEELARWLDLVVERGYRAVSLRWSKLPPACAELARARGLAVFVWTLNASAELEAALEMGVDGVITDRPERALALRRRR